jgi:hypothetical protein
MGSWIVPTLERNEHLSLERELDQPRTLADQASNIGDGVGSTRYPFPSVPPVAYIRQEGGIEPLHVSTPRELKSRPSTSPTHPG